MAAHYFPRLFVEPWALVAPKKNATFLTPGKIKTSIILKQQDLLELKGKMAHVRCKFLPQIALSQTSLVLQTLFHAFCRPPSSILDTLRSDNTTLAHDDRAHKA